MFRLQVTVIRQTFQHTDMTCLVLTVWDPIFFSIVAPCFLIYVEFTHQQMQFYSFKEHIKIYIKTHINITPKCFGLGPSSGACTEPG